MNLHKRKKGDTVFNKNLFKYHCAKANISLESVANEMGVNPATLTRKMNGESDFTRIEIQNIRRFLGLNVTEAEDIFFADELAQTQV